MSDRAFDPEVTREVGRTDVPELASTYERFEQLVVDAGSYLEASRVSEKMAASFTEYHLLLRNAVIETRQNFDGLGPTIEQIAEDDELAEAEIDSQMNALAGETAEVFAAEGYTPMEEGQHGDSLTAAPSDFDAELGGAPSNRGEGVAR